VPESGSLGSVRGAPSIGVPTTTAYASAIFIEGGAIAASGGFDPGVYSARSNAGAANGQAVVTLSQPRRGLPRLLACPAARAGKRETVAGVYQQRLHLASGRFAMIDDGLGFPW
jgi:hypothetical protein